MPEPPVMPETFTDLDKTRLDIAWKRCDFHAKQRTTLFNFFLLLTGIILNAYTLAIRDNLAAIAIPLCLFGVVQSIAFMLFDFRNRQLTSYAENIIEKVERSGLFPAGYSDPAINSNAQLGLLIAERESGMREGCSRSWCEWAMKMKVGIITMHCLAILLFLFALVFAAYRLGETPSAKPGESVRLHLDLESPVKAAPQTSSSAAPTKP